MYRVKASVLNKSTRRHHIVLSGNSAVGAGG